MDNLHAEIHWIHYNKDPNNATGSIGGAHAAFTIKQVLPNCFRLKVNLPEGFREIRDDEYLYRPTMDEAKDAAQPYADRFFQTFADSVLSHPAISYIAKVSAFHFPAQFCHENCAFYGGDGQHGDVDVERVGGTDGKWAISRDDGCLFTVSQDWETPHAVLANPASEHFLWDLGEALEQVHFMHCG
jgi:hypothetical protein